MNYKEVINFANCAVKNNLTEEEHFFWLCWVTGKNRAKVLLHKFSKKEINKYVSIIKKRAKNIPYQKLCKKTQFLGVDIYYSPHALSPRPETEILASLAIAYINLLNHEKLNFLNLNEDEIILKQTSLLDKVISNFRQSKNMNWEYADKNNVRVLDLCTGSGCIGLAIKKQTHAQVTLLDKSKKALVNCAKNTRKNKLEVDIIKSDLFEKVSGKFDVIISNPPYIKTDEIKNLAAEVKCYDPYMALDGGVDGLTFYKKIIVNAKKYLNTGGVLFLEIDDELQKDIKKLLEKDYKYIKILTDFSGKHRFCVCRI